MAAAVSIAGLMAIGAAPAVATHVDCGDVIKKSTKLDSDLKECPGDGVVIGADGITLNLNGHTIDGGNVPARAGVRNMGHDRVTVKNGTIREFGWGVLADRASVDPLPSKNRFLALTVHSNSTGDAVGMLLRLNNGRVEENTAFSNGYAGIFLEGSDNRIWANSTSSNGLYGILVGVAEDTVVIDNRALSNAGDGIFVWDFATATLLQDNVANGNGEAGVDVDSAATTLTANSANFNVHLGIEAVPGVTDGGANTASANGNPFQCTNVVCS